MAVDYEKSNHFPGCLLTGPHMSKNVGELEQSLFQNSTIGTLFIVDSHPFLVRTREEAPGEMVWYRACNFTYRPGLNCCPKQTPPKPA
jgi:hypothetical protein